MFEHVPVGRFLRLAIHGASHAPAIDFTLSNLPKGQFVDADALTAFLERRAPGRDALSTARLEADRVEFLSGLAAGRTTGEPICGRISNADQRPGDYGVERTVPRPGHADFGQWIESGRIPTGGGANSGRLTVALCAAGGLCLQVLARRGVSVSAEIRSVAGRTTNFDEAILAAKKEGDSVGGVVRCTVKGLRPGLGGALFAGLESDLSSVLFAIPGVKGLAFGNGFAASELRGSENDDAFERTDGFVRTATNRAGGILGGRTTGEDLVFDLALKPTPTVFKSLPSVDLATGESAVCQSKGRHDPCIVRRAVPVVEAVTAFALLDRLLATEAKVPRICLTLTGATLEADYSQFVSQNLFVDQVEVRVDLLSTADPQALVRFVDKLPVPVLVTYRRKADGGAYGGEEGDRATFFQSFLASLPANRREVFVDFEADFRVSSLDALAREKGVRIVRSLHDFTQKPQDLVARCRALVAGTDEIAKIAFRPQTAKDVAALFRETADFQDVPHVVCAMGTLGTASRVLAARTHSLWTYASVNELSELGHLAPQELVRDFRFRTATREVELFGVTGWPLKKTRSPELHNAAFAAEDRDAVMAAFPAETAQDVISLIRALDLKGMAVTIPHKEAIIPLLDEVTEEARQIGAVNTIAVRDGRLLGFNTDAAGFSEALTAFLGRTDLAGMRVAVLGAGGASKAVVFALKKLGAAVEVFHRTTPPANFDVLVNATPVDPIPDYVFTGSEAVYDLVYVPEETPLLARARAAGCRVENGLSMLKAQARLQRQIWFGLFDRGDTRPCRLTSG